MAEETIKFQVTPKPNEHPLTLGHGYHFDCLVRALNAAPCGTIETISIWAAEIARLNSELSRTVRQNEAGADEDALLADCKRLKTIEQTGMGRSISPGDLLTQFPLKLFCPSPVGPLQSSFADTEYVRGSNSGGIAFGR